MDADVAADSIILTIGLVGRHRIILTQLTHGDGVGVSPTERVSDSGQHEAAV